MVISHCGFVGHVSFSNDKYIIYMSQKENYEKKEKEKSISRICDTKRILPIWLICLLLFASLEIHVVFLFLFVQKLAPRIYSY